eukprot:COSAG02_NODE_2902_length_7777_cov_3.802292_7_plen_113_part_00
MSALAMLGATSEKDMAATTTPPCSEVPAPVGSSGEISGEVATTPPARVAAATSKAPAAAVAVAKAPPAQREGPPPRRVSLWNTVYRRRICGARRIHASHVTFYTLAAMIGNI